LTATNNSWVEFGPYPSKGFVVPESCCARFKTPENKVNECRKDPLAIDFKVEGCFEKLEQKLMDHRTDFVIAGVVLLVIMVSIQ
jgi:hypothetical protein